MSRSLTVFRTHGSQRELGDQHGQLTREAGDFVSTTSYYPRMPANLLLAGARQTPTDRLLVRALGPLMEHGLKRLDAGRPFDLRQRSQAFAEALGEDPALSRYLGVMDVFQNAIGLLAHYKLVPFAQRAAAHLPPACSSLAVWGQASDDGRLLHARNFDFPGNGVWDERPTVVFCAPKAGLRYAFVSTKGADVPGVTAFNEAGLTVTAHTRFHSKVSLRGAAIVDIGHQIVRSARSLEEALEVASRCKSSSSWGLLVSSASERAAWVLELTAERATFTPAREHESFRGTTNRYHHPAHKVHEVCPSAAWVHDCEGRLRAIEALARRGGCSVAELQRLLGSHTDPGTGRERAAGGVPSAPITVQSIVNDPDNGVLYVGTGRAPTGHGPWTAVPWDWEGPALTHVPVQDEPIHPSRYASGDRREAHQHYLEAVRRHDKAADRQAWGSCLHEAARLAPEDSTYGFLSGATRLGDGEPDRALACFEAGLQEEEDPFRRGQLCLWAMRAAQQLGDRPRATRHRESLLATDHRLLAAHQQAAWTERGTKPSARRWKGLAVDLHTVRAG